MKIKRKYDIDVKENIPQFGYGIPDAMRKKWCENEKKKDKKCIFDAFEGGRFGPSHYYFINYFKNKYYFRFGYSKDRTAVENSIACDNLHEFEQNKLHYDLFISDLKELIKNWDNEYVDNNIMDGTQWHIKDKKNKIDIYGSNKFPDNYDELVELFKKYFNVSMFVNEED